MPSNRLPPPITIGTTVLAVAMTASFGMLDWLSYAFSSDAANISTWRPIPGIVAALCLGDRTKFRWKTIFLAIAGALLARLLMHRPMATTVLTQAVVGASIFFTCRIAASYLGKQIDFRTGKQVASFLLIVVCVAIPSGAIEGIGMNMLVGHNVLNTWLNWTICTSLSYAVLTPLVTIFAVQGIENAAVTKRSLVLSSLVIAAVLALTFSQNRVPTLYLIPLALVGTAMFCEIEGAAIGLGLTTLVSLGATAAGYGPANIFNSALPMQLAFMEVFLATLVAVILPVAAALTEQRRLKRELIVALHNATVADRAKSDFLSNMSHEIRTPLTSVIGFSELLANLGNLSEPALGFAQRIHTGAKSLLALVNDILDYSKLDEGKVTLAPEPACPGDIMEDVVNLLAVKSDAKKLALSSNVAWGSQPLSVLIDPQRVRQILLNMAGNAIKFTDSGSVVISACYCENPNAAGWLHFAVTDTGKGIPEERKAELFQRFTQLDNPAGMPQAGAGLGLAICKGLVTAMGGEIGVESIAGSGSTFWFKIPAPLCAARRPPVRAAESENPARAAGRRILVVDDNQTNRILVRLALSEAGLEIIEACSGEEAIAQVNLYPFDIILMDIRMPGMGGTAAMRSIRSAGLQPECPIIAFTAEGDRSQLEALKQAGFDDTLSKPLETKRLREIVTQRLGDLEESIEAAKSVA